ncbi:hypothetical protein G7Y89_g12780 [Cudoniella acicularis]|uniref:aldehyde dehydrogenase (NAD(+)) n=1 Tax=Cudoniella acicularis TaxID=354080 RepID=A0A8H4RBZ3_9HELO|nr:hypothetical protein G7Y89_g12780 [Cudoniella acicularis]
MADLPHVANWVDGAHTVPTSERIVIINPATESPIGTIDATPRNAVNDIVAKSRRNFANDLEVQQTGRPVREMKAQLARIPEWLEYFASLARVQEGSVTPFKGPVINTLTRLPIGVVAQITPWNHPLLIATKKIGAALAAGNTVIVKPSELAPLSVLKLGELFKTAGLPDGTLQIICGYGKDTGKFLCENPKLAKIDLTGGLATYRAIAPSAGYNMVPLTAELGGKAPVCIFPSMGADLEQAVKAALFASFIASGQTCVTGSRLLIHADIYDELVKLLVLRTKALRIGDPTSSETQIGAVINKASVDRCAAFVSRAEEEGGKVLCGGKAYGQKGFFFEPTLIETDSESDLSCNEVFGPVIAILKCMSEDHMLEVANGTNFALGASVWTRDFTQALRVADKIEAGIVWVNGHHLNDPSSPWGGFKESGIGKENGRQAFESYTKVKSTVLNYGILPTCTNADTMLKQKWAQALARQITEYTQSHVEWIGVTPAIPSAPVRMLDYACGSGVASLALLPFVNAITGIDVSESMVEKFNEAAYIQGLDKEQMHAFRGDLMVPIENTAENLKTDDLYNFDIIVISMALHHVEEPQGMILKLVERLRDGGAILIIDWAPTTKDGNKLSQNGNDDNHPQDFHSVLHTRSRLGFGKEEMEEMLQLAGCSKTDYAFHPDLSTLPSEFGGDKQLFFARGTKSL